LEAFSSISSQRYHIRWFCDWDNCVSSLKEVVDALVTGGLIVSDAPAHLDLQVVQALGPERSVCLEVWPAQAP
jgi:hypothetical protein